VRLQFWIPLVVAFAVMAVPRIPTAAAEPAAGETRHELFSAGPASTAVYVTASNLAKIKLAAPIKLSDSLTVTHIGVGVFEKEPNSGSMFFRPTTEVPLKTGLGFGWVMKVDSNDTSTQVVETFKLPRRNGTWSVDPNTTVVSDDGLTATTTEEHTFWDFLWRVWTLEDGDPDGAHSFGLKVAGKSVAELKFQIVKK
jgi:hypothetical protein